MHTYRPHRLMPLVRRQEPHPTAPTAGATHDMLILNSRPDLTPEFPAALAHPTQRNADLPPPRPVRSG